MHLGMGREELIERLASREPAEQHPHSHTRSGEDGGAAVDLGVTKRTLALASAALLPKCRRRAGLLPAWPDPSAGAGPPAFEGEGGLRLSAPTPATHHDSPVDAYLLGRPRFGSEPAPLAMSSAPRSVPGVSVASSCTSVMELPWARVGGGMAVHRRALIP